LNGGLIGKLNGGLNGDWLVIEKYERERGFF